MQPTQSKPSGTVHERLFEAFTHLAQIGPEDVPDGDLEPLSQS